jgi:hypothetical protein
MVITIIRIITVQTRYDHHEKVSQSNQSQNHSSGND